MNRLKLAGHSGCKLEIQKRGQNYVVIKTSKDKAYNLRLLQQSKKQGEFTHTTFLAPKVLSSSYDKQGLFTFSMEYINGFTLAEHLQQVNAAAIPSIAGLFSTFIPVRYIFDPDAKGAYQEKITELQGKIAAPNSSIRNALQRLSQHDWRYTMQSYCHGDLTLENIIYKDNELYLIDFLDSFYDSWMQDFGKLLFDLESQWSYRGTIVDENILARISIFKNLLLERLSKLPHGREIVREIYYHSLLHALRIVPYTKDPETLERLNVSISGLQEVIDSL